MALAWWLSSGWKAKTDLNRQQEGMQRDCQKVVCEAFVLVSAIASSKAISHCEVCEKKTSMGPKLA